MSQVLQDIADMAIDFKRSHGYSLLKCEVQYVSSTSSSFSYRSNRSTTKSIQQPSTQQQKPKCWHCQGEHYKKDCPTAPKKNSPTKCKSTKEKQHNLIKTFCKKFQDRRQINKICTAASDSSEEFNNFITEFKNIMLEYSDDIVFERFQKASLKIKLSTCQFFKTYLHYLGHRVSANGLEPSPEKVKAIRNLAPARNQDEALHILGLLGYYRSFVPAFANITLPTTSLLKKYTPFVWSDKCQLALEYLKEIFCNKLLLQFPDPNKPYVLYTYASNNVCSSVFCQPVDNDQDIRQVA